MIYNNIKVGIKLYIIYIYIVFTYILLYIQLCIDNVYSNGIYRTYYVRRTLYFTISISINNIILFFIIIVQLK